MGSPERAWLRVALTLLLGTAGALVCEALRTPIPWTIGPLLAVAAFSLRGAPTASAVPLRNAGQGVIGCALGLYFTPQVGALLVGLWWAVVLAVAWALLLGLAFAVALHRLNARAIAGLTPATSYLAGAIGGASEMTLLAERLGARADLVASAHSLRVLIVVLVIPFSLQFSGLRGIDVEPAVRLVHGPGLAALLALATLGALVAQALRRTNPWFIGALVVSMTLTLAGHSLSAVPTGLSNAAQLVIGISLGVRFTPQFIHAAPRWLLSVAAGTAVMMGLSAAFGAWLATAVGLHPVTLILGTSPGGITEMAITAKVLQLGVPVVTAFQACRLVAVLVLVEPLYRLTRLGTGARREA